MYSRSNDVDFDVDDAWDEVDAPLPVWSEGIVDYSAANEYVRAHYGLSRYFDRDDNSTEQFHDARLVQKQYADEKEMLKNNGLVLMDSPAAPTSFNWSELKQIGDHYLPELERLVAALFPSTLMYCFWNPMIRGESYNISREENNGTPTANTASMLHIDTDVGAYESIDDLLDIIKNNKVYSNLNSKSSTENEMQEFSDAIIHRNKRFAIVNFWRNIGDTPAVRAPLAILSTRYDNSKAEAVAFPTASPDMNASKWYVFPNATKDEVIVFLQYDRFLSQPSDLWHCAVSPQRYSSTELDQESYKQLPPRRSFDIRALIVFDEIVLDELDRFKPTRTKPFLSFEESGCFCDEQAAKSGKT